MPAILAETPAPVLLPKPATPLVGADTAARRCRKSLTPRGFGNNFLSVRPDGASFSSARSEVTLSGFVEQQKRRPEDRIPADANRSFATAVLIRRNFRAFRRLPVDDADRPSAGSAAPGASSRGEKRAPGSPGFRICEGSSCRRLPADGRLRPRALPIASDALRRTDTAGRRPPSGGRLP